MSSERYSGSVVPHSRSNCAHGRVKRCGNVYGMSWLPGIASTGGPSEVRKRATRSCCSAVPRWVRSPLAITSSGSISSSRSATACSTAGSSCVPKWRSERWRTRLITVEAGYKVARMAETQDDSAEVFDDLYLGLRAGGAMRKQRRGEPLTREEEEALGHWQRLSTWRKAVAIGGFALGTFGLGFTLGGLVFGRWRKA